MVNKILFVGNTAWSLYNFRLDLMLFLKEKNYEIVCAAPEDSYASKLEENGITFIALKNLHAKSINPANEISLYKEFIKRYKQINPAIIFHYTIKPNIYGVKAAHKLGIPTIAITTGLGYIFNSRNIVSYIAKLLYKRTLSKAKEVWFLNHEDLHSFLNEKIIDDHKAFLLPGEGVNTDRFRPTESSKTKEGNPIRFIFSGRMIYEKGVTEFAEATRILKKKGYIFESVLLGFMDVLNPGAISKNTISDWESEGIIKYQGVTSDVVPFLKASDCLVLPSFYREGIPKSLLEAASLTLPIITTNNVGCREVVDDNITGYICEMRNVNSLAEKMEKFINLSAGKRIEMGIKGREKVIKEFDQKIVFDIYLSKIKHYLG
jgi:glycosyltransferase involved in cell wall biosynthesis